MKKFFTLLFFVFLTNVSNANSTSDVVTISCTGKYGTTVTKFNTNSRKSTATVNMPSLGINNKTNPPRSFSLDKNIASISYPKQAKMFGLKTKLVQYNLLTGEQTRLEDGKVKAHQDRCKLL